jgi:hypothetical protein
MDKNTEALVAAQLAAGLLASGKQGHYVGDAVGLFYSVLKGLRAESPQRKELFPS